MRYFGEQTIPSLVRNALALYGRNFGRILLAYLLPVFPILALQTVALMVDSCWLALVFYLLGIVASLFATGALTLLISNACLGTQLSVRRAYKAVFGTIVGKLLWTNTLQTLAVAIGLLLFVVPGLIFVLFFLFASPVVVLERIWGRAALKRSKLLGSGFHLRNAAAMLIVFLIGALLGGILAAILGTISFAIGGEAEFYIDQLGSSFIQALATPLGMIATILLYYDLRVRKEGYDPAALGEDIHF